MLKGFSVEQIWFDVALCIHVLFFFMHMVPVISTVPLVEEIFVPICSANNVLHHSSLSMYMAIAVKKIVIQHMI